MQLHSGEDKGDPGAVYLHILNHHDQDHPARHDPAAPLVSSHAPARRAAPVGAAPVGVAPVGVGPAGVAPAGGAPVGGGGAPAGGVGAARRCLAFAGVTALACFGVALTVATFAPIALAIKGSNYTDPGLPP